MTYVRRVVAMLALTVVALAGAAPGADAQEMAFEDVVAKLRSPDYRARIDALRLLKSAGYIDAVMPVVPLIADRNSDVQAQAIETEVALYLVDEAYTREVARELVRQRDASLAMLAFAQDRGAVVGNSAPAALIGALAAAAAGGDVPVRRDAIYAIGVLGAPLVGRGQFPEPKAHMARLTAALRDGSPQLRAAAAHVIGRLFETALRHEKQNADLLALRGETGDLIVNAMNDADEAARQAAITAAGQMRYDRAIQSLLDFCAYYKRDKLGLASLDALARIAHPSSLGQFAASLDVKDDEVRRLGLEGIARVGDKQALAAALSKAAGDTSSAVHLAAAFARARNGDFADLAGLLDGFKKRELQGAAFSYVVELGPALVPALGVVQGYKDAKVRAALAEALGIIGNASTLTALDALARDKDRVVAAAAQRSQARLTVRLAGTPRTP